MSKVVLITGTNSGFGWLTANSCAAQGHTVYATMRDIKGKNAEKAKALSALPNVHVLEMEVTNPESVEKTIASVIAKEGKLDVVVNNAGVYAGGLAETFTEADLERMFDVNVKGPWRVMRASLPQMRQQGEGLIVNISSGLGRFSAPFMTIYNSSKFAVEGITEGIHYEVKNLGVDAVLIQPGAFPTELFHKTSYGSDTALASDYGPIAMIPEQMGKGMGEMFEALQPNPQLVADAVVKLIDTPKGQRPLRTVVDPITGKFTEEANQKVHEQYVGFLTAFGMGDLVKQN